MRTEPISLLALTTTRGSTLVASSLGQMLHHCYAIVPEKLDFVPTGWISACYRLTCGDGTSAFLKLQPLDGFQPLAASAPDFYLPLTRQLATRGILPHIAYPLPTVDGALWTAWEGWRVILYNHVPGRVVGHAGMTDAVVRQLAELLARLHGATTALLLRAPLAETFELACEAPLRAALTVLAHQGAEATAGQRALRTLLVPRRRSTASPVSAHLVRLRLLQAQARAAAHPFVVCHADLHGENLMLDAAGRLYILDWEGAILAPVEQDMIFFAGEPTFDTAFRPAYEALAGPLKLDAALLDFYWLRRGLDDVADWVLRIMAGDGSTARDEADLVEIADCLAGLADS